MTGKYFSKSLDIQQAVELLEGEGYYVHFPHQPHATRTGAYQDGCGCELCDEWKYVQRCLDKLNPRERSAT